MYSNNKLIRDVADVAARIMSGQQPVTEKLHPNQQKLDVHEPEKDELTADDFKKLRAKKLKEDVTTATQRLKAALDRHVAHSIEASRNDDFEKRKVHQDYIHKIRNQLGKLAKNEEVEIDEEQLDELSKDTLASYEKKSRVAAHKHALASELKGLAADPAGSYAHKMMADKRHAGWKVAVKKLHTEESDLEEEQLDELSPKTLGSYVKNAHQDQKERSFSAGYNNNETDKEILKDKKRDKNISKAVNKLVHKANEELEIDEASRAKLSNYISAAKSDEKKDRSAGIALAQKKKWGDPKYGTVAAKVPANEEVEAIDEIKLADLPVRKIQGRAYGASTPEPHAVDTMEGPRDSELKKIAAEKKKKKFSEMVNLYQDKGLKSLSEMLAKEEVTEDEFNKEIEDAKEKNAGKKKNTEIAKGAVQAVKNEETEVVEYALDVDAINGVAIENIEERHMTEPETKKKEEIVKSMKKGLSGFKDRYGDRAKEVMYATATARAKGE